MVGLVGKVCMGSFVLSLLSLCLAIPLGVCYMGYSKPEQINSDTLYQIKFSENGEIKEAYIWLKPISPAKTRVLTPHLDYIKCECSSCLLAIHKKPAGKSSTLRFFRRRHHQVL